MDALARVVQQATTGAAVRQKGYAYDPFGNLKSKKSETAGELDVVHTVATGGNGPYRLTEAQADGATTRTSYSGGNMVFYAAPGGDTLDGYALSGPSTEVSGRSVALFRSETQLVVAAAGTNQLRDWPNARARR